MKAIEIFTILLTYIANFLPPIFRAFQFPHSKRNVPKKHIRTLVPVQVEHDAVIQFELLSKVPVQCTVTT
jgi:hypothetical protein